VSNAQSDWSRVPWRTRQHIKSVLLARDGLVCCVCGLRIPSVRAATIEHKRERSAGGALTAYSNLGLAHTTCNYSRRGSREGRVPTVAGAAWFGPTSTVQTPAQGGGTSIGTNEGWVEGESSADDAPGTPRLPASSLPRAPRRSGGELG